MNKELPFQIESIQITFTIPKWFPQERFDYNKVNSESRLYGNKAEDSFFKRFPDCIELCTGSTATFEIEGYVSEKFLQVWIKSKRIKLFKFFNRYTEWKEFKPTD